MNDKAPLVTVITPTYNIVKNRREETFRRCVSTVQEQTYTNIEHIVIDGGSTDKTIDILQEYENKGYIRFISEADNGIYNAMNKGICMSQGDYIIFLNSDDCFIDDEAIEESVKKIILQKADFCYAKAVYVDGRGKEHLEFSQCNPDMGKILFFMPFCHQTMVSSRRMFDTYLFNEENKSISDYEWLLKNIVNGAKGVFLDKKTIEFRLGGMSDRLQNRNFIRDEQLKMYYNVFKEICCDLEMIDCEKIIYEHYIPSKIYNAVLEKVDFVVYRGSKEIEKMSIAEELRVAWNSIIYNENQIALQRKYFEAYRGGMDVALQLRQIGYKNCAIYGFAAIGEWIVQDLEKGNFIVKYIIDQRAEILNEKGYKYKIVDLSSKLEPVDVIIITPIYSMNIIKKSLKDKIQCSIISIEDLMDY